ncbi:MAG: hypothetical protein KBC58_03025 [Flavobacterium sp.]|nr:hypothetical protein [Flavobacterium sp.]
MKSKIGFCLITIFAFGFNLFGQVFRIPDLPNVSYSNQVLMPYNTITPIVPTNIGGAFPTLTSGNVEIPIPDSCMSPSSICYNRFTNTIYIVENQWNRIRKINFNDDSDVIFAGAEYGEAGNVNGTGQDARFNGPNGISIDGLGNLYVTDSNNNCIRKITPQGVVSTIAGSSSGVAGFQDGLLGSNLMNRPYGIHIGGNGNIYFTDSGNHAVRVIYPGGYISTLGGNGIAGSTDSTGSINTMYAAFNTPKGITLDNQENIFVVDSGNNKIRKISINSPNIVISTYAGTGASGANYSTLLQSTFSNLNHIVYSQLENGFFVTGSYNVIKLSNGNSSLLYQNQESGGGYLLKDFSGMFIKNTAELFVAELANWKIYKMGTITPYKINPQLPSGLILNSDNGIISGSINNPVYGTQVTQ